jgi:hypothetical protein
METDNTRPRRAILKGGRKMKMAKLEIKNYECWLNETLDFTLADKKTIATRGGFFGLAGTGKSTATRAIRWCLHGDLNEDYEDKKPNIWKNGWEENQFVRITYLTDDGKFLTITRTRRKENLNVTEREMKINGEDKDDPGVVNYFWKRYFGIAPKSSRDVDWYIKPKQMTDTYRKITDKSKMQSKLLSLTEISDLLSRIQNVDEQIAEKIIQLNENLEGGTQLNKDIEEVQGEIDEIKTKKTANDIRITEINKLLEILEEDASARIARIELDKEKDEIMQKYTDAQLAFAEARSEFKTTTKKPSTLIPTIISGILEDSGLSTLPKESFVKAKKYRLDVILQQFGDEFSEQSKKNMSDIIDGSESEFKGVSLYTASDYAESMIDVVQDLKNAIIRKKEAKVALNEIEAKIIGMSKKGNLQDILDQTSLIDLIDERDNLNEDNDTYDLTIDQKEGLKNEMLTKQSSNTSDTKELDEQIIMQNVSNNLIKDLRSAKDKFTERMFARMVKDVKSAWNIIDGGDTGYKIDYVPGDNARMILVDSDDEEISVELDSSEEDGSGKSSTGMFGMACLSMAMAKLTYLDLGLPILLDDATTFLDVNKEARALKLISEKFGQVIYVANRLSDKDVEGLQVEFRFSREKDKKRKIEKVIL